MVFSIGYYYYCLTFSFAGLVDKLLVYPERMLANLEMTHGVIFSQLVLLQLVAKGMSREEAYAVVQRQAMNSWESGRNFKDLLTEDAAVSSYLGPQELAAIFQNENFVKHVDFIFERIFGEKP